MATEVTELCKSCGSNRIDGEVIYRRELARSGMTWLSVENIGSESLCTTCYSWTSKLMSIAASGEGSSQAVLGMPVASGSDAPAEGCCDYCAADLRTECFAIDLVPDTRRFVRTSLFHHVGQIRQQRVCRQCYAWFRSVIEDSSALRGSSNRQAEGPMGGWLTTVASNAVSLFLLGRDEAVLGQTVEAMGRILIPATLAEVQQLNPANAPVIFVAPNQFGRAAMVANNLSPELRSRLVVVTRPDALADASEALKRGAADLLASPLSPQQIAGAMERVAAGGLGERGPAVGLPVYRSPLPRLGIPCHGVQVQPPSGDDPRAVALLVRRFLRGYDRVGEDGNGGLQACIYCSDEHLPGVLQRMQTLLGERCKLKVTGRAAPGVAAPAAAAA